MGVGIVICVAGLIFSIVNAALGNSAYWLNIVSLAISSGAAILSFVLSGVATYLSDKSSKQTEAPLKNIENTFQSYINYIASTSLRLNEENADDILESIEKSSEKKIHQTPVVK